MLYYDFAYNLLINLLIACLEEAEETHLLRTEEALLCLLSSRKFLQINLQRCRD